MDVDSIKASLLSTILGTKFQYLDENTQYPIEIDGNYKGAPCIYKIQKPNQNGVSDVDVKFKNPVRYEVFKVSLKG